MSFATPAMSEGIRENTLPFSNSGVVDYRENNMAFDAFNDSTQVTSMSGKKSSLTMTIQPIHEPTFVSRTQSRAYDGTPTIASKEPIPLSSKTKHEPAHLANIIAQQYLANTAGPNIVGSTLTGKKSKGLACREGKKSLQMHDALVQHRDHIERISGEIESLRNGDTQGVGKHVHEGLLDHKKVLCNLSNELEALKEMHMNASVHPDVHAGLLDHKKGMLDMRSDIEDLKSFQQRQQFNATAVDATARVDIQRLQKRVDACMKSVQESSNRFNSTHDLHARKIGRLEDEVGGLNSVQDNHKIALDSHARSLYKVSSCLDTTQNRMKEQEKVSKSMHSVLANHRDEIRVAQKNTISARDLKNRIKAGVM